MLLKKYNKLDYLILEIDASLKTIFNKNNNINNKNNAIFNIPEVLLNPKQRKQSQRWMRINHCGEICAQALYRSQALVSRSKNLKQSFMQSATEEIDHLDWCKTRLTELNTHATYFKFLFYWGSFLIGASVGLLGDQYSLNFLAATEKLVAQHLDRSLKKISFDLRSCKILLTMLKDESLHEQQAYKLGAEKISDRFYKLMYVISCIMVSLTFIL